MIKKHICTILLAAFAAFYCLYNSSCANTHGSPTGGPKDTIPPVIVATVPDSNATMVSTDTKSSITITFNEYIQLKDANRNILLSPPQKKRVKTRLKGKSLIVSFEEPLDSNRTYTLYFGSALADNNEGNVLQDYAYSFSTGKTLDSLLYSGTVLDYSSLLPLEGVTVALYLNPKDSSVMTQLPDAITRSDKWGYFCFRNLKGCRYTLYAFKDENNNNLYDPGVEDIGFLDSAIIPTIVMDSTRTQLARYSPEDTLNCMARPIESSIYLFREKNGTQYIREYKRTSNKGAYIKFGAMDAVIDSFSVTGIRDNQIIKQFNQLNDSLSFWINDPRKLPDTLTLGIKYMKTDSLGNLAPATEELKLIAPKEKKETEIETNDKRKGSDKKKQREDLLEFKLEADPKLIEQTGYIFTFNEPLVECNSDSIIFTMSTPRKVVTDEQFKFEQDSANVNRYYLRPVTEFKTGNEYSLLIPRATFRDINGFTNDTIENKVTLPTDDRLSTLNLDVTNVDGRYIVELVNETRDKVFRQFIIKRDSLLHFPYLDAGRYSIRITQDKNNNGLLDPGIVLKRVQPEMVRLYKMAGNSVVLEIGEKMDLEQEVDIAGLFKDKEEESVEIAGENENETVEEK